MKMEILKGAGWWYVMDMEKEEVIAGFKTKKAAMEAMKKYEKKWA